MDITQGSVLTTFGERLMKNLLKRIRGPIAVLFLTVSAAALSSSSASAALSSSSASAALSSSSASADSCATHLCVYDFPNFGGVSLVVVDGRNYSDLRWVEDAGDWNDRIISGRNNTDDTYCLYANANFEGPALRADPHTETKDLNNIGDGWSNRISSIKKC